MASESCLVAGPTGVGLGGILLNGIDDYLVVDNIPALGDFTLVIWFLALSPASTMTLCLYPDAPALTFISVYWRDDESITYRNSFGPDIPITTAAGVAPAGRWNMLAITREAATGVVTLYVNGALAASDVGGTGAIPAGSLRLGDGPLDGPFSGAIGHVFLESAVRDLRWVRRTYHLMRRNVVEFIQELLEREMGETVDQTTFDAAADLIDGITDQFGNTGALCCDGFITEQSDAQTVLDTLTPFRDLRLIRNPAGAIEIYAQVPQADVVATFGLGDGQYENLVDFSGRTSSSLAEAIKTLPMAYRRTRDDSGQPKDYRFTIHADVLPVGKEADRYEMPFVYTHVTADILRDWRRKGLIAADEQVDFTAAHEARKVQVGQRIRLQVPSVELPSDDYRVSSVENRLTGFGVKAVPYSDAQETYEPGDEPPADPVIDEGVALRIGPNVRIKVTGGDTVRGERTGVVAEVQLIEWRSLAIIGNGDLQDFNTVVGAANAWQAVLTDDGDTSYVQRLASGSPGHWFSLFAFDTPTNFAEGVSSVRLTAVLKEVIPARVSADDFSFIVKIGGTLYELDERKRYMLLGALNHYVTATVEIPLSPATGRPWTEGELASVQAGIRTEMGGPGTTFENTTRARITKFGLEYGVASLDPSDFSGCHFWLRGPAVEPPVAPTTTDPPDPTGLIGLVWNIPFKPATTGAERYWVWARLYDAVGRPSRLIGPTAFPWEPGSGATADSGGGPTDSGGGPPGTPGSSIPTMEVLTPPPDGIRTAFHSTYPPRGGHFVMLFRKGVGQTYRDAMRAVGDFHFAGTTWTLFTPPLPGEVLFAVYWT